MLENCCRICLNNDAQSFDVTSDLFKRFFTEIIGDKNLPATIYLCTWCRSIFRKIRNLVTAAVHNMKLLSQCTDYTQLLKDTDKRIKNVFQLTCLTEHIDIPPTCMPPMDIDIKEELLYPKIEYINVGSDEELDMENLKREDSLDVEETFDLRTNVEIEENESLNIQNKKQIDYDQMKFEVRYLNLEEQLAEIENKRSLDRFNRMKFKCYSCGVGFLTNEVFEEHQKRHDEAAGSYECPTCRLRFKSQDVLSHHTLSHRRRFSCRLCPAVFNRWSHCVGHRFKCDVTGVVPQPAVCGMCHKIFRFIIQLNENDDDDDDESDEEDQTESEHESDMEIDL